MPPLAALAVTVGLGRAVAPRARAAGVRVAVGHGRERRRRSPRPRRSSASNLVHGERTTSSTPRTVTLNVSQTQQPQGRQEIDVSWSGAHPTGGIVADQNSDRRPARGVPVRPARVPGRRLASCPPRSQVSPQTCWTQTWSERYQDSFGRPVSRRTGSTSSPRRRPCARSSAPRRRCRSRATLPEPRPPQHWVPFVAADGHGLLRRQRRLCRRAARVARRRRLGAPEQRDLRRHRHSTARAAPTSTSGHRRRTPRWAARQTVPARSSRCRSWASAATRPPGAPPSDRPSGSQPRPSRTARRTGAFAPGQLVTAQGGRRRPHGERAACGGARRTGATGSRCRSRFAVPVAASAASVTRLEQRHRRLRVRADDPGDQPVGAELLPGPASSVLVRPRPDRRTRGAQPRRHRQRRGGLHQLRPTRGLRQTGGQRARGRDRLRHLLRHRRRQRAALHDAQAHPAAAGEAADGVVSGRAAPSQRMRPGALAQPAQHHHGPRVHSAEPRDPPNGRAGRASRRPS